MRLTFVLTASSILSLIVAATALAAGPVGYYRQPAISRDTIVFVAEGDLWRVPATGGVASRLTSHAGDESLPAISPDGKTVAFVGQYEGQADVYTMPLAGGRPRRRTYGAGRVTFVGWTPDGKVLYSTDGYSTLPSNQLVALDIRRDDVAAVPTIVPLAQAADGCYDPAGKTLYFTRLPFQGSHTKRYAGGTAQNLWKFAADSEAVPLSADYKGTSKRPLWWQERIYFVSDRDGSMNLWSMRPDGSELKQHTRHAGWDVADPSVGDGRIVYQLGADLRRYDIASGTDRAVPITLDSDLDQTRENWVKTPMQYLTSAHLGPDAEHVVLTARGQVFVVPRRQGRLVEAARKPGVRYRNGRLLPDGKSLLLLSDESGEVEFWKLPANGVGAGQKLTGDGEVLRWEGVPSPDGKHFAHYDKNQRLFLYDFDTKENRKIDESPVGDFSELAWSPDSRWLAYVGPAGNMFDQVKLYRLADRKVTPLTTDRFESRSPAWSPDDKWIYFLSDRNLATVVESPWGNYQPEPFLDKRTKLYHVALKAGLRSPFAPADELHPEDKKSDADKKSDKKPDDKADAGKKKPVPEVAIDLDNIAVRLVEVPVPSGNYRALTVNDKALFWLSSPAGERKSSLQALAITNDPIEVKTVSADVKRYELSADGKKLLIHKGDAGRDAKNDKLFIIDAAAAPADLAKKEVDLSHWSMAVPPREEWRQMFREAWRLERDYFYDRGMHGVDWKAILDKYQPLVDRVQSRAELSDLTAQMVSELAALHIFVRGGDLRAGQDKVAPASLGADLDRDDKAGGYRVRRIYRADPDMPEVAGPLSRPGVDIAEGDVIESINGAPVLSAPDVGALLRQKAGEQVLVHVKKAGGPARDVIVTPIDLRKAEDLRYHDWEYSRRRQVEELGKGELGYVHLRAMSAGNFTEWARNFYPVFNRKGLVIDVRHNRGGNIDSWIIGRLLRKAWFYWSQRIGRSPSWNMQYAFRGHVVVLCDEFTASDGEAFAEGIKRLGIGKVIGTRTWGGEIWLSSNNLLVDQGIATAAEEGVFGPEGVWLIEGHGVEPDVVVDNPPHATFLGEDAQLKAGVAHLQKMIREKPVEIPPVPRYPDKSFRPKQAAGATPAGSRPAAPATKP
jgi:tricorn protease